MKIKSIRFKNILSYGNKIVEYNFKESEISLISGVNGAGKTTLLDAMFYNLTGKAYRSITLKQLINSKNKKNLYTEGSYATSTGTKIKIIRGKTPDIFQLFIDDVEQDKETSKDFQKIIESKLEFNPKNLEKLFLISSVSYKSFLKSSPEEKRKLIDQLIEIESFSKMTDSMKQDRSIERNSLSDVTFEIDKIKSNLDLIENFQKSSDEEDEIELKDIESKLEQIKKDALDIKTEKEELKLKEENLESSTKDLYEKDQKQLKAISSLQRQIFELQTEVTLEFKNANNDSAFFNNSNHCSKCKQDISDEHKKEILWEVEKEILVLDGRQLDINTNQIKCDEYIKKNDILKDIINQNKKMLQGLIDRQTELSLKQQNLKNEYVSNTKRKSVLESVKIKPNDSERISLLKELNECYDKREKITKSIDVIELSIKMFGEKYLRSHIISKYLPILNTSLKRYLDVFNLPFMLTLDNEFKETIHDRNYKNLSYSSLSEGEKKRVDLSLIFAFFDLTKIRSKQSSNILVMDEVLDSSLDFEGINGLADIIYNLKNEKMNVIIISHNSDVKQIIDFDNHIEVVKNGIFSEIKE